MVLLARATNVTQATIATQVQQSPTIQTITATQATTVPVVHKCQQSATRAITQKKEPNQNLTAPSAQKATTA